VRPQTRFAFLGLSAALVVLGASACSDGDAPPTAKAPTAKVSVTKTPVKSTSKKAKKSGVKKAGAPKPTSATKAPRTTKAPSGGSKAATPPLTERTFVATDLGDQKAVKGSTIQLSFGQGKLTAKPGCNTLRGPATWSDGMLSIGGEGLVTTKNTCRDALAQQDVWVQALLEAKPKLVLKGSTMKLDDGFSRMTLQEKK
jgi:heat shock protein HslJ